ncbi:MAG: pseudouridine synthase [Candidatus Komeilibacteria bacterium]
MRLQKFLSQAGVASRRQAEQMIAAGKVEVNDEIVDQMGVQVDPTIDHIKVNHRVVKLSEQKIYLMVNKPVGVITTCYDPQQRETIYHYLPEEYDGLFPIGRLDKDTSGLILLTNDGDLAQELTHPSYEHQKEYLVKIKGEVEPGFMRRMKEGVELEEGVARADDVKQIGPDSFTIILHQGWKRQIRRMVQALNYHVLELKRIRINKYKIEQLGDEDYKLISRKDII